MRFPFWLFMSGLYGSGSFITAFLALLLWKVAEPDRFVQICGVVMEGGFCLFSATMTVMFIIWRDDF